MAAIDVTMIIIRNTADALLFTCFEEIDVDLNKLYIPNINAKTDDGFTVLHVFMTKIAFCGGSALPRIERVLKVIEYLIKRGVTPNSVPDNRVVAPVLIAGRIPDEDYAIKVLCALIAAGAQLECVNRKQMNMVEAMKTFGERRPKVESFLDQVTRADYRVQKR